LNDTVVAKENDACNNRHGNEPYDEAFVCCERDELFFHASARDTFAVKIAIHDAGNLFNIGRDCNRWVIT
jgi:hypothetical protein